MAHYFPEGQEPKYDKLRIAAVFKELESRSFAGTSSTPASGSTAAIPRPCATSSPRSACCRAPRFGAVHPRETQAMVVTRSARRGRAVHRRAVGNVQRDVPAALQLPPYSVGETGRLAAPSAAKSATASSPGARSARSCRRTTNSPTRCAWSPRSPNPRLLVDGLGCAAPRWR